MKLNEGAVLFHAVLLSARTQIYGLFIPPKSVYYSSLHIVILNNHYFKFSRAIAKQVFFDLRIL